MKKLIFAILLSVTYLPLTVSAQEKAGNCSKFDPDCINNPFGAGSPFKNNGINNPFSDRGSPFSNKSAKNPYATNAPKIYDENGNYRGRLSNNPYDPDSTSNPYGRYGSPYSPDSINNPYGAGRTTNNIYIEPPK